MRPIKFRAWDKVHKEFLKIDEHIGCFLWGDEEYAIPADRKASSGVGLVSPCQPDKGQDYFGSMSSTFFGDDIILMQYTGLKDKNGKEIYEGDILKSDSFGYTNDDKEINGKVVWNAYGWHIKVMNEDGCEHFCWIADFRDIEVIGNIYENPELLCK